MLLVMLQVILLEAAATVTGAAQTNITSLGTLTALTVDDVVINGKVVTMTGSTSDTAVFTAGTNGTLSIVTTDDSACCRLISRLPLMVLLNLHGNNCYFKFIWWYNIRC